MNRLITIDPGAKGGIAWRDTDGEVYAINMPDGMTAQVDELRNLSYCAMPVRIVSEKVGYHRPGNNATASCKFARHCGHIEAATYCLGIPTTQVAPNVWMKVLGALPKDKKQRKKAIKEEVQRRFPHLKVTLYTADALGILIWATQQGDEEQ